MAREVGSVAAIAPEVEGYITRAHPRSAHWRITCLKCGRGYLVPMDERLRAYGWRMHLADHAEGHAEIGISKNP